MVIWGLWHYIIELKVFLYTSSDKLVPECMGRVREDNGFKKKLQYMQRKYPSAIHPKQY